jgi:hypothetical protein
MIVLSLAPPLPKARESDAATRAAARDRRTSIVMKAVRNGFLIFNLLLETNQVENEKIFRDLSIAISRNGEISLDEAGEISKGPVRFGEKALKC